MAQSFSYLRISIFECRIKEFNMKPNDLLARTKKFALRVIKLVDALPNTLAGRTIGGQVIRSGTSVSSNYRAACRARSKAEFIAKLGIVEEEADESCHWMELIIESKLMKERLVIDLLREANEITAIMVASKKTSRSHNNNRNSQIEIRK
jgi:four helix bundle protein